MWLGWRLLFGPFGAHKMRCFDKKRVKSPTEIVRLICSFLTYWTGLLEEDLKDQVIQGAEVVKASTLFFHKQDLQAHSLEERQIVPFAG
jgi:hypothetical protein